jgi:hypothetical protein
MAEFYVNRETSSDGTRPVHRDNCAKLPAADTLLYLGSFGSAEAAHSKASNLLSSIVFCPDCLQKAAGG